MAFPASIEAVLDALNERDYVAERSLGTTLFLMLRMERPLFLEGEAGVGKTEIARVLAGILQTDLIRLQCYEGLDLHTAVYEWNYARQMLQIRLMEAAGERNRERLLGDIFDREFLIPRPLLQAVDRPPDRPPPVLLIDELDRADEEFEAFLLELLSDYQITIPELGTIRSPSPPYVVITSNRTREIHDALKRRCLYYWIDYPSLEKELHIVRRKVPGLSERLADDVVAFVQELRHLDLYKLPGVAETLDWAQALMTLSASSLSPALVRDTLGTLLKYQDDMARVRDGALDEMLERVRRDVSSTDL